MNRWLRSGSNWGPGAPRRAYSETHWKKPLRWNADAARTGRYRKVFPSVCDPFDNAAPEGERERFAELIRSTPHLVWLLLTKRIGNAGTMLTAMFPDGTPENVWLGATIVNQEEADRDIPKLIDAPASRGRTNQMRLRPPYCQVAVTLSIATQCGSLPMRGSCMCPRNG